MRKLSGPPARRPGLENRPLHHVAAANCEPVVFVNPDRFDPARGAPPHLTFGTGRRPCPGNAHAVHPAAGVVDAIVQRCWLTSADAGVMAVVR